MFLCESFYAFMNIVFKVCVNNKKYNFQIHVLLEACMGFLCANKAMLHYEICVQLIEIIKNNGIHVSRVLEHLEIKVNKEL